MPPTLYSPQTRMLRRHHLAAIGLLPRQATGLPTHLMMRLIGILTSCQLVAVITTAPPTRSSVVTSPISAETHMQDRGVSQLNPVLVARSVIYSRPTLSLQRLVFIGPHTFRLESRQVPSPSSARAVRGFRGMMGFHKPVSSASLVYLTHI